MKNHIQVLQELEEGPVFGIQQDLESASGEQIANAIGNGRHGLASEEALRLVHQVFLPQTANPPSVVVFAGMDHGNGCSQICASVAEILARDGRRPVCLVEANFRSPALSGSFWTATGPGLTGALTSRGPIRSFARQTDSSGNLWLLSSGALAADSPALLTSGTLRDRLAELRAEFDFVVIDAPPLNRYADAIALGQLADGVVLVLEAGSTRRDETAEVAASLRASNITILAAVLNKRSSPIPQKIYRRL
jgi:Mrp family chromosome partitioning ATPase